MTIPVTAQAPTAPTAQNTTIGAFEDFSFVFSEANFPFTDTDGNNLAAVRIVSLPTKGTLSLNGTNITGGQLPLSVPATAIAGGTFKYLALNNESGNNYATFTFQIQDDGILPPGANLSHNRS